MLPIWIGIKFCYLVELTLGHTILTFNDVKENVFENIVGKGENAGKPAFSSFPTMFSTHFLLKLLQAISPFLTMFSTAIYL